MQVESRGKNQQDVPCSRFYYFNVS